MPRVKYSSFLNAREPSIDRRYRKRPNKITNLLDLIEDDSEIETKNNDQNSVQAETARVYLRLRPVCDNNKCKNLKVAGNILIAESSNVSYGKTNAKHFTFSDIFDESVDQSTVYEECIRDAIESEESLTVLAYGTSGSGKTFTLLGEESSPGIIQRSLEHMFKHYGKNIYPEPFVKPDRGDCICFVDNDSIIVEEALRNTLLSSRFEFTDIYNGIQKRILEDHNFESNIMENRSVFIWISFVEIYNEYVYDLLIPEIELDIMKRKRLKVLSNNGNVFIKDLTYVNVRNSEEAFALLVAGLSRIKYASTKVNDHSSRSHCLFFVNIITYSQPDTFVLTTYKFCDLAGSERQKKTGNVGCRFKEAMKINNSLTVLGRCLDAVHRKQNNKNVDVVPFRDSKLTMLLQAPLLGKEKLTMIVNLAPIEEYHEENMNVLGFASIAKSIVFKKPKKQNSRATRYSWFATQSLTNFANSTTQSAEISSLQEDLSTLRLENELLKHRNIELQKQRIRDVNQLRWELTEKYEKALKERDETWEKRLELRERSLTSIHEMEVEKIKTYYRRQLDLNIIDDSD